MVKEEREREVEAKRGKEDVGKDISEEGKGKETREFKGRGERMREKREGRGEVGRETEGSVWREGEERGRIFFFYESLAVSSGFAIWPYFSYIF